MIDVALFGPKDESMKYEPSPKQILLVWRLLFTGEEPKMSAATPALLPRERAELVEAGLIRLEKRGKSRHLVLTDRAWGWAAEHLDAEISTRSPASAPILKAVLTKLKTYLETADVSLAEILRPRPRRPRPPAAEQAAAVLPRLPLPVPAIPPPPEELEAVITRAYLLASGSGFNAWVRLADLRSRLPLVARPDLDRELLRLEKTKRAILYPIDDPQNIRAEDREAAIDIVGFKRHLVLMKG